MQIGMIGLGRMGGNMVRRLIRGGHECVVYDLNPNAIAELVADGASGAGTLDEFVQRLQPPRTAWIMVPAGDPTEGMVQELAKRMEKGDAIVDGGNSYYKDDVRRGQALAEKGIYYVDAGTSGGVWGLERGYCLMVGGERAAVERLDPIWKTLAPGRGDVPPAPGREGRKSTAEDGYLHCGGVGAGHFVKMVHNGIEYGLMQAYAEGFDIFRNATSREPARGASLRSRPRRHRRGLAARQRGLLVAARPDGERARRESRSLRVHRRGAGLRRRALDGDRGDRGGGARPRARRVAVRSLPLAPGAHLRREDALRHALQVRRPRGAPSQGRRSSRQTQGQAMSPAVAAEK